MKIVAAEHVARGAAGLACLLALAAVLAAAPAPTSGAGLQQAFAGGNVKATVFIPSESVPRFGFVPVRLSIDNRESRELRWEALFAQNSYSNSGGTASSRFSLDLTIPASRQTERWIFVPTAEAGTVRGASYNIGWSNFNVQVNGTALSNREINFNPGVRSSGATMTPWAASAALESTVRAHVTSLRVEGATRGPGGRSIPTGPRPMLSQAPNLVSFDPAQPLSDWRVWSPFARVLLGADEHAVMPPANRAALRSWVALGGTLYLAPTGTVAGGLERVGAGSIVRLQAPIAPDNRHDSEGLFTSGNIFSLTPAIPAALGLPKEGMLARIAQARLVGDWLVYFFVGFAVLIAPVNLFAIAPARRRHWLFLTVPAISVVAVAVLGTAIFLQDGVGGDGVRRALVVLAPGEHQAAVFQEQVSRTGLLFGTGFPLADDTVCASIPLDESATTVGRPLEFARSDGRASGDWFRGRARQAQHLRRLTPTRARVEQVGRAPDRAPIVLSSVGATLREFFLLGADGRAWFSDTVPPGTRVTLRPAAAGDTLAGRVQKFSDGASASLGDLARNATRERAGGCFVAQAGESELAPLPTLASIRWQESAVLITGVLEGAGVAAGKAAP